MQPMKWLTLAGLAAACIATRSLYACPMCIEALVGGGGGTDGALPRAFYFSILFMLAMPFVLVTAFSVFFYRLSQSEPANHEAESSPMRASDSAESAT